MRTVFPLIAGLVVAAACLAQGQPLQPPVAIPPPSAAAIRYYQSGNWLWAFSTVWGLLVPALLVFTGFSARLNEWAKSFSTRWYVVLSVYFIAFASIIFVADFAFDYYADFVRPHAYGLSSQAFVKWSHDEFISFALSLVGGILFLWIPYLLLRRAPRRWWLYTWLASIPLSFIIFFVEPIWIEPLFNDFTPMHDGVLKSRILELGRRAGIDAADVFEVNKSVDTNQTNAYVTGIGSTQRIVLWDTIIKDSTPDELLATMGHEMGHYVLGHVWKVMLVGSLMLLVGLWSVDRGAGWILREFGARIGISSLADASSLPLLLLTFGVVIFFLSPVLLAFSRHQEHEADRFGLEITRDNHACASSFAKIVDSDLAYPTPGVLYEWWRASHPSLGERIEFCNDYHPWRDGHAGRYAKYFKNL